VEIQDIRLVFNNYRRGYNELFHQRGIRSRGLGFTGGIETASSPSSVGRSWPTVPTGFISFRE
jgi:hypothetical protein